MFCLELFGSRWMAACVWVGLQHFSVSFVCVCVCVCVLLLSVFLAFFFFFLVFDLCVCVCCFLKYALHAGWLFACLKKAAESPHSQLEIQKEQNGLGVLLLVVGLGPPHKHGKLVGWLVGWVQTKTRQKDKGEERQQWDNV